MPHATSSTLQHRGAHSLASVPTTYLEQERVDIARKELEARLEQRQHHPQPQPRLPQPVRRPLATATTPAAPAAAAAAPAAAAAAPAAAAAAAAAPAARLLRVGVAGCQHARYAWQRAEAAEDMLGERHH